MQVAASSSDLASVQAKIVDKKFDEALADLDGVLQKDAENTDCLLYTSDAADE